MTESWPTATGWESSHWETNVFISNHFSRTRKVIWSKHFVHVEFVAAAKDWSLIKFERSLVGTIFKCGNAWFQTERFVYFNIYTTRSSGIKIPDVFPVSTFSSLEIWKTLRCLALRASYKSRLPDPEKISGGRVAPVPFSECKDVRNIKTLDAPGILAAVSPYCEIFC